MYRERPSAIAGAVVWWSAPEADGAVGRVLPDGCMDLMWSEDRGLVVAGPDTRAHVPEVGDRAPYVGVRFPPGVGPDVLGVPACELRDLRVPLAEVWPGREVRELTDRFERSGCAGGGRGGGPPLGVPGDAPGGVAGGGRAGGWPGGAAAVAGVLEAVAARRLVRAPEAEPWRDAAVASLARGRSVAQTADAVGLSERQLRRRSLAAFGYGPKTLARVLRMRRALALARRGVALAEVAAACGYADQAHLAREVRALAGVPITAL
ncbi:helix-turn-helix domain-containing protein [Streptomyces sp. 4N509B]|uniref:helix-turn-helix domain-containing protein n=1 Tax=Streptomyces sp. 4N509B TaxID=3457413 RepID=UPI003FD09983